MAVKALLIAVLDRNPPVFAAKSHTVTLPEAFKQSVRIVQDAGWGQTLVCMTRWGASTCWAMSWLISVVKLRSAVPAATPSASSSVFRSVHSMSWGAALAPMAFGVDGH